MVKIFSLIRKIKCHVFRNHYRKNLGKGGDSVIFYGKDLPIIKGEKNIFLGKKVKINEYAYFYARGKARINIGDYSTISSQACLITAGYDLNKWLNEDPNLNVDNHNEMDISIGRHCWIGNGAKILPGVKIEGENVVIAAGAIVTKSFSESNVVIGGIPAKIIKTLV